MTRGEVKMTEIRREEKKSSVTRRGEEGGEGPGIL